MSFQSKSNRYSVLERPSLMYDTRHIHDRSGIFMGSWDEMEKVKKFHA